MHCKKCNVKLYRWAGAVLALIDRVDGHKLVPRWDHSDSRSHCLRYGVSTDNHCNRKALLPLPCASDVARQSRPVREALKSATHGGHLIVTCWHREIEAKRLNRALAKKQTKTHSILARFQSQIFPERRGLTDVGKGGQLIFRTSCQVIVSKIRILHNVANSDWGYCACKVTKYALSWISFASYVMIQYLNAYPCLAFSQSSFLSSAADARTDVLYFPYVLVPREGCFVFIDLKPIPALTPG